VASNSRASPGASAGKPLYVDCAAGASAKAASRNRLALQRR
jgi:hypothetical protein